MSGSRIKGSTDYVNRFWNRVRVDPSGCWIWTKEKTNGGYGRVRTRDRARVMAHIVAWELIHGIPSPTKNHILEFDHLCRNRACVNPAHLEIVTPNVNQMRGVSPFANNARKTHCLRGHSLTEFSYRGRNGRVCKLCEHIRMKARNERRKAYVAAGLTRGGKPKVKNV